MAIPSKGDSTKNTCRNLLLYRYYFEQKGETSTWNLLGHQLVLSSHALMRMGLGDIDIAIFGGGMRTESVKSYMTHLHNTSPLQSILSSA